VGPRDTPFSAGSQLIARLAWHAARVSQAVVSRPTAGRVLVVDDERSITDVVATALRYDGFETREAANGRAAQRAIDEFEPDLIILDVMLPDHDGFRIARRLREAHRRTPIIFLTAKDAPEDKLAGLALGDDYVTKPFGLAEIVARVRAVLRRTRGENDSELAFADVVMNEDTREVRRGALRVELTRTEFELLRFFMLNPRRVLTKRQILDNVWHYDFGGDANVVETYVSYLRRKLEHDRSPLIHTIRLVGYALREPGR
jgi:two-component system, OmpR family, response regulator